MIAPGNAGEVRRSLGRVLDPELRLPITELGMVAGVDVDDGGRARVEVLLTVVGCPAADRIEADARAAVLATPGVTDAQIAISVMSPAQRNALTERLRGRRAERGVPFGPDSLTRVFAITSGKGGVGKSTVAANLAVELARRGLAVGLVDADVFGFSIPGILGLVDERGRAPSPTRIDDLILPPVAHGVKTISIGMFLPPDSDGAVSWRGPMLHRTLSQFLTDVHFGDLDALVLDLPPGTGDVAISLGQLLPTAEVVVVTTPQPAAADVAERSATVARQTGQRVVGVVETMSGLRLPDGSVLDVFGSGGGEETARRLSRPDAPVPLLARIPLSPALRAAGDRGEPFVLSAPEDPATSALRALADALLAPGRELSGRHLRLRPR